MLARIRHYKSALLRISSRLFPSKRGRVIAIPLIAMFVTMGVLGVAYPAFAADSILKDVFNALLQFFSIVMFSLARLFIGLTIFALKFFIEVASYNDFIGTPTVKIGWFLVRDVANMFFVVILLIISFGTILGLEQYEWKKTLGKLIFAAIFINFSNMIAQLFIDVAHVFTITFVNALSATAGGNIINMFNIDRVYSITGAKQFDFLGGGDIRIETFTASVAVFFLAAMMMVTMGAYTLIMVARMVVLWTLIILSPLAYIFQVIPATQKYAQEWWTEFSHHVIVAPVMVFFLWLSFATLGTGNANIIDVSVLDSSSSGVNAVLDTGVTISKKQQKLSISEATTWENMASYIISIAFLLVGLRTVRSLGVIGGDLTSSVMSFAKNVGTIATGYAVGRAAYEGVKSGTKATVGFGLRKFPGIGGDSWKRRGKTIGALASYGKSAFDERRNNMAIKLGKSGSLFKKGVASVIESSGRKEKKVTDFVEAAERRKKITEAQYSTSSSAGGRIKERITPIFQEVEEKQKAKSEAKVERRRQAIDDITVEFRAHVENQIESDKDLSSEKQSRTNTQTEEYMKSKKGREGLEAEIQSRQAQKGEDSLTKEEKKAITQEYRSRVAQDIDKTVSQEMVSEQMGDTSVQKQFRGTLGKKGKHSAGDRKKLLNDAIYVAKERAVVAESRAESEDISTKTKRKKDVASARARDERLKGAGRDTEAVHEKNVLASQAKEDFEKQGVGDYKTAELRAGALVHRVKELRSLPQTDDTEKKLANMYGQVVDMVIANNAKGAAFGDGTGGVMLREIGVQDRSSSMKNDAASMNKRHALLLSRLLTEDVSFSSLGDKSGDVDAQRGLLEKKMAELEKKLGEHAQAKLEQLLLALEKTAGDGSIGNAGMLRRREDVNGNMVVGLTDARGKDGIEFIEGRRTNARSSARITSVSGLGGSADTDESGKAVLRSDAAVEEISTMLSRLTSNQVTSVDEYTLADLASLFTGAQTDQGKLNSFIQAIKAKAVSGDAMGMVGKQLVSIAKKDGSYEKMDEEKKNSLDELAAMTSRTIRSSSASADPSAEAASSASVVSSDSVPAASSPPPPAVASTTTSASGAPAIVPTPTPTPTPTHTSAPTPEEQGVYVGPENSEEDIINNNNAIYGILQREGDMDADNITEELLDRIRIQIDNTALERDIDGPDYNPYSDKKNVQDALPVAKQQIKEREELAEKTSMVSELQNIASIFEAQKTDGDSDATLTEILGVLKDEGGETKKAGAIDLSQLQTAMSKALAKQTQELSTALKSGGMNEDVEQADLLRIVRAMNAQHASGETGEESKDAPATLYDKLVVQEIKNLKSVLVRKTGSAVHTDSIQAVRKSLPTDDTQRKQALENEDELVKKYTEAEDKRTRRS